MKNKLTFIAVILLMTFTCLTSHAQTIELNTKQSLTISSPGFFAFSTVSNDQLKNLFPTNSEVNLEFSNFLGNPCAVAPAADFSEIGPQIVVNANGEFTIDFSGRGPTAQNFGLSFVPQGGGTCIFDIFLTPPQVNPSGSTSSSSSSSSSGSIITTTSSLQLIQNAIDQEKSAKSIDLKTTNPNLQNAIQKIETSLSSLNELKNNVSNSMSDAKALIEKNITCAIDKDNQVKEILNTATIKDILKAKKLLRKALRCKKVVLKQINKLE